MAFTHDESVDLAVAEIGRMAAACEGADLSAPVPSCPGWDLGTLVHHTGSVHRWAATMVERSSQERLSRGKNPPWEEPADRTDAAALVAWFAAGGEFVEARFRDADLGVAMWAWGWPKTAAFWPRRMIHETTVHRADTELALGERSGIVIEAAIAADGVDELLDNLPQAASFAPGVAELRGDDEVLAFVAGDDAWAIRLQGDGFTWARTRDAPDAADAVLTTPSPADLLLTLYRRRPPQPGEVSGDAAVVERWLANSAL